MRFVLISLDRSHGWGRTVLVIGALWIGGTAAMLSGCRQPFIGTTAGSYLRRVQESDDPNLRYLAYSKLADPNCYDRDEQKHEAVRLLSEALEGEEEAVASRAEICKTLGAIGLPEARPALLRAVSDPDPMIRAQACWALGKVGAPEDATILAYVMTTDTHRDCRVAAIEALGALKAPDPRIDLKLVEGMSNPDPAIRAASYESLVAISGNDLGIEVEPWRERVLARLQPAKPSSNAVQQASFPPPE